MKTDAKLKAKARKIRLEAMITYKLYAATTSDAALLDEVDPFEYCELLAGTFPNYPSALKAAQRYTKEGIFQRYSIFSVYQRLNRAHLVGQGIA